MRLSDQRDLESERMMFSVLSIRRPWKTVRPLSQRKRTRYMMCDIIRSALQQDGYHTAKFLCGEISYAVIATVFSFGALACQVAGICTFTFQDFVLPSVYSLLLIMILGVLAFLAEVLLARSLQLEKTSKVANVQFIEVTLTQTWLISSSRLDSSFGRLICILLILISISSTMYIGPDKETE